MVDLFGRIPVHERQWLQHIMAVPGGGSAYARSAVLVFQGPVGAPSVFQHETSHAVDGYLTGTGLSPSATWRNAIAADTCVPDNYANTSTLFLNSEKSLLTPYR